MIVLEWLIALVVIVVFFATEKYLPSELRNYIETQKTREVTLLDWIDFTASIGYGIAYLIIYIGLYKFKIWAKTLLLPLHIFGLLMTPLHGAVVFSGWVAALSYLYCFVAGGILFLVYLSPVSEMFRNDNPT